MMQRDADLGDLIAQIVQRLRFGQRDEDHAALCFGQAQVVNPHQVHGALAHRLVFAAPQQRHAITNGQVKLVSQALAQEDRVAVVWLQEAALADILRVQADGRLDGRLDANDLHRVGAVAAADDAAGVDAPGRDRHLGLAAGGLHHRVGVFQRQQRQPVDLGPVAGRVHHDIAAVQTHGVAKDRFIRTSDQAVHQQQQQNAQDNCHQGNGRPPPITPHVTPGQLQGSAHACTSLSLTH